MKHFSKVGLEILFTIRLALLRCAEDTVDAYIRMKGEGSILDQGSITQSKSILRDAARWSSSPKHSL